MSVTVHRWGSAVAWGVLVCLSSLLLTAPSAQCALRSSLDRPDRSSPPMFTVGPTVGGSPDWQLFRYGASGSVLFRPDTAAELFTPLYDWNTGLVLQWEYRDIDVGRSMLAADVVLRRYLETGDRGRGMSMLFVGIGGGVAGIDFPPPTAAAGDTTDTGEEEADTAAASGTSGALEDKYYSFVVEVGYERDLTDSVCLLWMVQWRNYVWGGRDFSNYSVHIQLGFPLPW